MSDNYDRYADTWREEAACRSVDQEMFFPTKGDASEAAKAKAVCALCPVRGDCLDFALDNNERIGIWGGLAPRERARLRRASRPPAEHGTRSGYGAHLRRGEKACPACMEANRDYQRRARAS